MVCVHQGGGAASGLSEFWGQWAEYCGADTNTWLPHSHRWSSQFVFFPSPPPFQPHRAPFECQSECQLVSSCVALMSQSGRGDIYITPRGWELEPTGMKSSSTDSASLQGRRCTARLRHFKTLSTLALLLARYSPPRTAVCWHTWLFYQRATWAAFNFLRNNLFCTRKAKGVGFFMLISSLWSESAALHKSIS